MVTDGFDLGWGILAFIPAGIIFGVICFNIGFSVGPHISRWIKSKTGAGTPPDGLH
jgi:hypothetical protein